MDVLEAIELLKKYEVYDAAENECRRKNIYKPVHDMQGQYKIYCSYLFKIWVELRDRKNNLLKIKCVELDNIPKNMKLAHDDCSFVGNCCSKDYCKTECKYYKENIAQLEQELDELSEAQEVLKEASEQDFYLR